MILVLSAVEIRVRLSTGTEAGAGDAVGVGMGCLGRASIKEKAILGRVLWDG